MSRKKTRLDPHRGAFQRLIREYKSLQNPRNGDSDPVGRRKAIRLKIREMYPNSYEIKLLELE